ncbi:MAG: hypothetical protein ACPGO5_00465 [Patescibacteria group bacterium]
MIWWVILFLIFLTFAYGALRGAPYVPTWGSDVGRFIKLVGSLQNKKVYDLGCGDGRLVVAAARRQAEAVGYEVSFIPYILARIRVLFASTKCAHVRFRDFWFEDISDADVVYVFLMQKVYPKLKEKFEKELKSGAKVILYVWPMEGWEPLVVDKAEGQPTLFVYEMK